MCGVDALTDRFEERGPRPQHVLTRIYGRGQHGLASGIVQTPESDQPKRFVCEVLVDAEVRIQEFLVFVGALR